MRSILASLVLRAQVALGYDQAALGSRGSTTMEYRRLGESGLKVSRVCLGANMFGERTSASEADRIVASAVDAGVNFIDTADNYGDVLGDSERIVGRLIATRRDYWVL